MKIPSSSISRISLYYRALLSLKDTSVVSSQELADLTGCNAAQVRKDLAYFGQFGRPGRGYDIGGLRIELKRILGIDKKWKVALVGVGNLGSALLAYKGFKEQGFDIKYAFDNDPKKIGKIRQGIKIEGIKNLGTVVRRKKINMAIIAVPQESIRAIVDALLSSGVRAILNFAPARIKAPEGVEILNIDLSVELERLTYFLQSNKA